jgi:predicted Zn finger-like uncharacterized protein
MRIVCPSCQAAYEVPDKLLSSGPRKVRCAKCGKDWMAEAEAPAEDEVAEPPADAAAPEAVSGPRALPAPHAEEAAEPDLPPPPAVVPEPARAAEPAAPRAQEKLVPEPGERPSRALVVVAGLAWLASVGVLAGAGWAAVAFRADVMAAWGASRRLYALLGLG